MTEAALETPTDLPSEVSKTKEYIQQTERCCEKLRELITKLSDTDKYGSTSSFLVPLSACVAQLKWLNRESHLGSEKCKLFVQKHRDKVQEKRISVENFRYQREQLMEEIASCKNYHGCIDDLSLISLEEAGVEVLEENLEPTDLEHKTILLRLQAEQETRLRLSNQVQDLQRRKSELESELMEAQQFMNSLPKEIERVRSAASQLSTFFQDYSRCSYAFMSLSEDTLKRMFLLPFPLYVLSREAYAFERGFQTDSTVDITVRIRGDSIKAEEMFPIWSKEAPSHDVVSNNLYERHPLQVQLEVSGLPEHAKDETLRKPLIVTFSYLLKLEIVVVSISSSSTDASVITDQFASLFPGDDGCKSPNPANAYLEDGHFQFHSSQVDGARPFIWAQIICGLWFPFEWNQSPLIKDGSDWLRNAARHSKHIVFASVIKALVTRNYYIQSLTMQFVSLQRFIVPVNAEEAQLPADPQAELKSWVELSDKQESDRSFIAYQMPGIRKFLLEIQSESIALRGLVAVYPDYPLSAPYWSLKCIRGPLHENDLRDIERELCAFVDESIETKDELGENLLSIQVKKLQACVDICQEIIRASSQSKMVRRPRWDRAFRGRLRTKPFVFNPESDLFETRMG
eukprot:jgi/Galph1/3937/GphlegSOOS_G2630.1